MANSFSPKAPPNRLGYETGAPDHHRELLENACREKAKLTRLNKKLRNQIGASMSADIDIRDHQTKQPLGYLSYNCRSACGQARLALSVAFVLDKSHPLPVPRVVVNIAETTARLAPGSSLFMTQTVVHELHDSVLRQVVYASFEAVRYFLFDPGFRRAEGIHPMQSRDLTFRDMAILDHVRRFGKLPNGLNQDAESNGLVAAGLLVPVESDGSRLKLTGNGSEWLLSAARQMREGFPHLAAPHHRRAGANTLTRQ